MFNRRILVELRSWAERPHRKSLILRGARQVGKTTAIRMFGKEFDHFIELNLEEPDNRAIFKDGTDVVSVFNLIMLKKGINPEGGRVLLFIDEIQHSPQALLSLRYFYERMPHLYVIAAGSLLDVYLRRDRLEVPVGRVEYLWMYPCNFEEFLEAAGQRQLLELVTTIPFPEWAQPALREQFVRYALVGGMPEAIIVWLQTENIMETRRVLSNILGTYRDDAVKYAASPEQSGIIRFLIGVAPSQATKQISFERFGGSAFRAQQVKTSFSLLELASLLTLLYPYTTGVLPALPKLGKKPKLQFLDTGFINLQANLHDEYFLSPGLHAIYKGVAMEHLVGQQLISTWSGPFTAPGFWVRDSRGSSAEVDYTVIWNGHLIPIEVKAGKTGTLRSLMLFMEEADHGLAVRIYDGPTRWESLKTPTGKPFNLLSLNLGLSTQLCSYLQYYTRT